MSGVFDIPFNACGFGEDPNHGEKSPELCWMKGSALPVILTDVSLDEVIIEWVGF
jgi:hypothetical protein